jgi:hypothetical protein
MTAKTWKNDGWNILENDKVIAIIASVKDINKEADTAALIAAAPDLLVALESTLRVIAYESAENKYSVIVEQARAAIAKAKGQ